MTRDELDEQARTLWDESADAWHEFVESGRDFYRTELHGPALVEACGDVAGREVLDLGSGQGWFSRQLAGRGARVTGVDWAERLVTHARRIEAERPMGIEYVVGDAAEISERFAGRSFDLVTGCMSVMDMPRPGAVLAAAKALLREGGRIVFSVPNPVTDSTYRAWKRDETGRKLALEIDRYFDAEPHVMDWNMRRLTRTFRTVQYRFTLEAWSRLFEEAGLVIARMREPRPDAATVARWPELGDAARVPFFTIFDVRPEPATAVSACDTAAR